ncbi:MAG TPA: hypothetical protein VFM18_12900, partial [Methanosarcina sp.]|nr:hypothetical protein [Methanosarcina sp.]
VSDRGALNPIILLADGWEPGMILQAKPCGKSGRLLHVSWGDELYQSRIVFKHEVEIIEP